DGSTRAQQGHAAARDDAFLDGGTGGVQRVLDTGLLLLHLDFGRRADADDRDAAGQLRDALMELLAVVVAGGFLDLGADGLDPGLDGTGLARAVDDGRVLLAHFDPLGLAEVVDAGALERHAGLLGDHGAAGQDGHVLEHRLATITEARRLDGAGLEDAADVVHDQGRERFAFDFLGDDQQRTARLGDAL